MSRLNYLHTQPLLSAITKVYYIALFNFLFESWEGTFHSKRKHIYLLSFAPEIKS